MRRINFSRLFSFFCYVDITLRLKETVSLVSNQQKKKSLHEKEKLFFFIHGGLNNISILQHYTRSKSIYIKCDMYVKGEKWKKNIFHIHFLRKMMLLLLLLWLTPYRDIFIFDRGGTFDEGCIKRKVIFSIFCASRHFEL